MPTFALLVKPLIDSPGNATAFSMPGVLSAMPLPAEKAQQIQIVEIE